MEEESGKKKYGRRKKKFPSHVKEVSTCKKVNSITCEVCQKTMTKKNLYKHQRDIHGMVTSSEYRSYKCSLCDWKFTTICQYGEHLNQTHSQLFSVDFTVQDLTLDSETEFHNWKSDLEKETVAEYIKHRGPRAKKDCKQTVQTTFYYCNRSGHFTSQGERKRQSKLKGTNKINGICPAFIRKTVTKTGDSVTSVSVTYCDKHLGHQMEPGRLHLPKQSRKAIAHKLAVGVPMDRVLMEENQNLSSIGRKATRQDLRNIMAAFNINKDIVKVNGDGLDPCELRHRELQVEDTPDILIVITNGIENEQLEAERNLLLKDLQEMILKVTNMDSIENIRMISENLKLISAELQPNQMLEYQPVVIMNDS